MQLTFYKITNDHRYLKKNKTIVGQPITSLYLKDETNVVDPIILLDDFPNGINYCYLDVFDRYYYLRNVEMQNGLFATEWHVDVLESFRNDILKQKVIAKRTRKQSEVDYYLQDSEFMAEQYTKNQYFQFDGYNAFSSSISNYVLAVMGTGGDTPDSGEINVNITNTTENPVNIGGTIGQYETTEPTPTPTPPTNL